MKIMACVYFWVLYYCFYLAHRDTAERCWQRFVCIIIVCNIDTWNLCYKRWHDIKYMVKKIKQRFHTWHWLSLTLNFGIHHCCRVLDAKVRMAVATITIYLWKECALCIDGIFTGSVINLHRWIKSVKHCFT